MMALGRRLVDGLEGRQRLYAHGRRVGKCLAQISLDLVLRLQVELLEKLWGERDAARRPHLSQRLVRAHLGRADLLLSIGVLLHGGRLGIKNELEKMEMCKQR
jgi:hypothetical protein